MASTAAAGLTEGGVYQIQSVKNNQLINIRGAQDKNGTDIINWDVQNAGWNDHWKTTSFADGNGIKITVDHGDGKVLDEAMSSHTACLYGFHSGQPANNQRWVLKPVLFTIKNVKTGRVLRSNGNGNTITTVNPTKGDRNTWWNFNKLTEVTVDDAPAPPPQVETEIIYVQDPDIIIYE